MALTNEGKQLLKKLCAVYRKRRKSGDPIRQAGAFGSAESIQKAYFPDWDKGDVIAACRNLKDNGYLDYITLDMQPDEIELTGEAVAYSQQTVLRYLPKCFDWLWRIVELVFPVR